MRTSTDGKAFGKLTGKIHLSSLRITDKEREMLKYLSDIDGITMNSVIRMLIRQEYFKRISEVEKK